MDNKKKYKNISEENLKTQHHNNIKTFQLPKERKEMKNYIEANKLLLREKVLDSILFAIDNNIEIIEIFTFKDTNFVITITEEKYEENVRGILNLYLKDELYEHCIKIKNILNKLEVKNETQKK